MKDLKKTSAGLPNTCSKCGKQIFTGYWFAESDDHARAGIGFCAECAAPKPKPKPEKGEAGAPSKAQKPSEVRKTKRDRSKKEAKA